MISKEIKTYTKVALKVASGSDVITEYLTFEIKCDENLRPKIVESNFEKTQNFTLNSRQDFFSFPKFELNSQQCFPEE